MASLPRLFETTVALRVFASFVVAAVVPLAVTAVMVFTQVTDTLAEQAQLKLSQASSTIGQQLLDRLLIADDAVRYIAAGGRASDFIALEAAQLVTAEGRTQLFGTPFPLAGLGNEDGERSTLTVRATDEGHAILISAPSASGTIVGKLDADYLWEASTLVPYAMNLCVLTSTQPQPMILFCTAPPDAGGIEALTAIDSDVALGQLQWTGDEGRVMAAHWELFIQSRFAGLPWDIVVSQPEQIALSPLSAFNRVFPYVIAISLLLTLLLSSVQIRRIMEPLKTLVSGTKRFAERDFSVPVKLTGNNEFSELADSMNEMASRLGHQFDTITALAEIDRLILSSQSVSEVLERVIERVIASLPDCSVSILLLDPDKRERAQLFSRTLEDTGATTHTRVELEKSTLSWLQGVAAGGQGDASWIHGLIPGLPEMENAGAVVVVPVFRADELRGALITQIPAGRKISDGEHARLVEFAGRLAVAVSAADHESELFRRAHFDSLTGLPNRQLCFDRLYQAIAQARREDHRLAVLFIDLDRFKNVNDTLGHGLGDELLKEVAYRLTASVRETDTVARLGGDEYVIILPHIHGIVEVETIVDKILSLLGIPFRFGEHEATVSASIGVTIFPDDAADAEELLQKADTAMYAAKDNGRAHIEYFQEEMDRSLKERLQLQQDLREAYRTGQFSLVYQAQLDLESGQLMCMEALLRWQHPTRGPVRPNTFIPMLEEMGMIGLVGRWVVETALADFAAWRDQGLQLPRISVNVSGKQLVENDFEAFLVDQLGRNGMEGDNLEIEITESCLVEDFDQTNELLKRLGMHGIRVAIDDFGTGYSSLGYLQGLQFDSLKIDRAFVQGLPRAKSVAIVEAVLAVANALGKEVVAEGLDSDRQRRKLVELGCHIGQGYLLSIPIPGDEVVEWSARLDQTSVIDKLVAASG